MVPDDCPSPKLLELVIEDELSEFDRDTVESHISTCEECKQRLDSLLEDDAVSLWRRVSKARETATPPEASLLTVRQLRPSMDPSISDAFASCAPRSPLPLPTPIPSQIGDYEIHEVIGRGGMSVVYRASQRVLGRTVAIKRLHSSDLATEDLERLYREARAIARVQHPNIVQVFEVGTDGDCPYLALEYVAGGNLASFLNGSPIDAASCTAFLEKVARAIHHAHTHGIVHRDVKPANILLQRNDSNGSRSLDDFEPKVADFGLARLPESTLALTNPDVLGGTPAYLAPELIRGAVQTPTPAMDVYALGVVLYEMLTGRPPLLGPNALATVRLVDSTEPVPPRRLQPQLARNLETICLKCLAKDPARRYRTALALAEDLQRFRENRPIEARRSSRFTIARMWCRRNPLPSALAFLSAAILVAGLTGIVWQWRSAVSARKELQASLLTEEAQRRQTEFHLYAAAVAQAALFWENGDVEQARQVLVSAMPAPGREDFRGWEWHYLNDLFHSERHVLPCQTWGHAIALIPGSGDGFAVAVGLPRMNRSHTPSPEDGFSAWLSGTEERPGLDNGPPLPSGAVAVAASRDGKTIAWGAATGEVVITDAKTKMLTRTIGKRQDLTSLAFFDDDRQIAVGSADGTCDVYNVSSGERLRTLTVWNLMPCVIAVDPQRKHIAFAGGKGRIPIFSLPDFRPIRELPAGSEMSTALAFDPDGKTIVTANSSGTVILWNLETLGEIHRISAHNGPVYALAFAPAGDAFATAGTDRTIRIWDRSSGKVKFSLRGHGSTIRSLAYTENGSTIVSGSQDATIRVWDARRDPRGLKLPFDQHLNAVALKQGVAQSTVRASHLMGGVKTWRMNPLVEQPEVPTPARGRMAYPMRYQAFLREGDWLAGRPTGAGSCVAVWDLASGKELFRSEPARGTVATLATDSSQRKLVWASETNEPITEIHCCNSDVNEIPGKFTLPAVSVRAVAISSDGRWIAAVSRHPVERGKMVVWLMPTDRSMPPFEIGAADGNFGALAFSPDGTRLAYGHDDSIVIYNLPRRERSRTIRNVGASTDVDWSPDGRRVACIGYDGIVAIAHPESGKVLFQLRGLATIRPNAAASNARVSFSSDGRGLVSTNWDGSINVWNPRR